MTTPYNRDELGRFAGAPASGNGGAPNGGGATFRGEGFKYPETRDALLAHATSHPSSAPRMSGSSYQAPPGSIERAASNSRWGEGSGGIVQDAAGKLKDRASQQQDTEDSGFRDFAAGHVAGQQHAYRTMGYSGGESAGQHDGMNMSTPTPGATSSPASGGMDFGDDEPGAGTPVTSPRPPSLPPVGGGAVADPLGSAPEVANANV